MEAFISVLDEQTLDRMVRPARSQPASGRGKKQLAKRKAAAKSTAHVRRQHTAP
jgi:hypothetical protein